MKKVKNFIFILENKLAILLVYLINTNSPMSYFLSSIPANSPLMFQEEYLSILSNLPIYKKIKDDLKKIKQDYLEIRSLIYSHGDEFRTENFGNFYFGDFIWA